MWVGTSSDALHVSTIGGGCIINCANRYYEPDPDCPRHFWLHVMHTYKHQDHAWLDRMDKAVSECLDTFCGTDRPGFRASGLLRAALLHCFAGKHRSGAVAVLFIMLLEDVTVEEAQRLYFERRPLPGAHDQWRVRNICKQMNGPGTGSGSSTSRFAGQPYNSSKAWGILLLGILLSGILSSSHCPGLPASLEHPALLHWPPWPKPCHDTLHPAVREHRAVLCRAPWPKPCHNKDAGKHLI